LPETARIPEFEMPELQSLVVRLASTPAGGWVLTKSVTSKHVYEHITRRRRSFLRTPNSSNYYTRCGKNILWSILLFLYNHFNF